MRTMEAENVIEMLHITKEFPGIIANDDITLQLRRGEIHALLGENGAGKSTLMSVLFGLYQPEAGEIKKNGKVVKINNPNDATALGIGMVHQHFQLVDVFTVLDNIILGAETTKLGFLQKKEARKKVEALSEKYGLQVDLDARVENITVGMQQRVEILKMLYRDNEILIFDEPTAVLTPQEIDELMATMKEFAKEGKSILFISHKLNEIMAVADRVTVLRKGKYIGTVDTKDTDKQSLSNMMVGRPVQLEVVKEKARPGETVLKVEHLTVPSHTQKRDAVHDVSFEARAGEILCIAGIDGNGQSELIYGLTGLEKCSGGTVTLCGHDISHASIHHRSADMSHIPEDRHKHGLVLDFTLEQNMVLQRFREPRFQHMGFVKQGEVRAYAEKLIEQYDVRSGQGPVTIARSMSGALVPQILGVQADLADVEDDHPKRLLSQVVPDKLGVLEGVDKDACGLRMGGGGQQQGVLGSAEQGPIPGVGQDGVIVELPGAVSGSGHAVEAHHIGVHQHFDAPLPHIVAAQAVEQIVGGLVRPLSGGAGEQFNELCALSDALGQGLGIGHALAKGVADLPQARLVEADVLLPHHLAGVVVKSQLHGGGDQQQQGKQQRKQAEQKAFASVHPRAPPKD